MNILNFKDENHSHNDDHSNSSSNHRQHVLEITIIINIKDPMIARLIDLPFAECLPKLAIAKVHQPACSWAAPITIPITVTITTTFPLFSNYL